MLMKEFKSAHSKMFSRRRNNERLGGETNELQASQQQQVDSSGKQPIANKRVAPTTEAIKTINTKKLASVLAPTQVVHLAAAN